MAGVAFDFDVRGLVEAQGVLGRVGRVMDDPGLAEAAAVYLENATKERIDTEKTTPEGAAWPGWSARHAATRGAAQSLLVAEGDLMGSVQSYAATGEARVGSNLVYAGPHQFGSPDQGIPSRAYLGVSARDELELQTILSDRIRRLLQ